MLKIQLSNYTADLNDQQLSIVRTSPYPGVATSSQAGNFIFNFTLPATDELKSALLFAHRPQSGSAVVFVPYRIDAGAGLIWQGTAKVTEASKTEYEVFCPVENGDFNFQARKVKLADLDLGGDRPLEPVKYLVSAENTGEAIEVDDVILHPDDIWWYPLVFDNITINPDSILNSLGDTIIINETGKIVISFCIGIEITRGIIELRIQRSGVDIFVSREYIRDTIEPSLNVHTELDVEIYDELKFFVTVRREPIFTKAIFTLKPYSMQVYEQGILNNNAGTDQYPLADYAVFPLENPESFSAWPDDFYQLDNMSIKEAYSKFSSVVNYYKYGKFPAILSGIVDGLYVCTGNLFCPYPFVAYLVKRILTHFGYKAVNNPFENNVFNQMVLVNHFYENTFIHGNASITFSKPSFNLIDHVPDMSVYDLLQELCKLIGVGYEVNNLLKTIYFKSLNDLFDDDEPIDISHLTTGDLIVKPSNIDGLTIEAEKTSNDKLFNNVKDLDGCNYLGEVATWLNLPGDPQINDCYFVRTLDSFYAWKYNPDSYEFSWVIQSLNFISKKTAGSIDNTGTIKLNIVNSLMRSQSFNDSVPGAPADRTWLIPASHQPGKFEGAPEMFQTEWKASVLYYHGLYPDNQDNNYPFASPDCVDPDGNDISGMTVSLRLHEANGIYETRYRKFAEWRIQAREVIAPILPDAGFLRSFRFSRKYIIDGVRYIAVEYRGNISKHGPEPGELTLLRF